MKLLKLLVFIVFTFRTSQSNAQDISWGPTSKIDRNTNSFGSKVFMGQGKFYCQFPYFGLSSSTTLHFYENTTFKAEEKLSLKHPVASLGIDNKYYVFGAEFSPNKIDIIAQEYGEDCKLKGAQISLVSIDSINAKPYNLFSEVIQSENKDFFCLLFRFRKSKTSSQLYKYFVFSKNLTLVSEGSHSFQDDRSNDFNDTKKLVDGEEPLCSMYNDFKIANLLTNKGELFFSLENISFPSGEKSISFFKVTGEQLLQYDVKLDYPYISKLGLIENGDGEVFFTAVFGDEKKSIKGLLNGFVNFNNLTSVPNITEFHFELNVASDRSTEIKGNYNVINLKKTSEGDFIVIFEKAGTSMGLTGAGTSDASPICYVCKGNLLIYRVSSSGTFVWAAKFEKNQVEAGIDFNTSSGVFPYFQDSICTILYNDDIANYDASGVYIGNTLEKGPETVSLLATKKNVNASVLVKMELNLINGEYTRTPIIPASESGMLFVPRLFTIDYENKVILVHRKNLKFQQYGSMKF